MNNNRTLCLLRDIKALSIVCFICFFALIQSCSKTNGGDEPNEPKAKLTDEEKEDLRKLDEAIKDVSKLTLDNSWICPTDNTGIVSPSQSGYNANYFNEMYYNDIKENHEKLQELKDIWKDKIDDLKIYISKLIVRVTKRFNGNDSSWNSYTNQKTKWEDYSKKIKKMSDLQVKGVEAAEKEKK